MISVSTLAISQFLVRRRIASGCFGKNFTARKDSTEHAVKDPRFMPRPLPPLIIAESPKTHDFFGNWPKWNDPAVDIGGDGYAGCRK